MVIIAVSGPSGSGKSRLASAALNGLHVELDRFYRSQFEISRERSGPVDWEDVRSYKYDAAVEQLIRLSKGEPATLPLYDLMSDSVVGEERVDPEGKVVVAEGIFAALLARDLNSKGIQTLSICVTGPRLAHTCMRIWRDVSEGRLGARAAVKRSWQVMRNEPAYVETAAKLGAQVMSRQEARRWLSSTLASADNSSEA